MLWYQSWFDTRWRFLLGFAVCLLAAGGVVFSYAQLPPLPPTLDDLAADGGTLSAAATESLELRATFRSFVWSQWFDRTLKVLGLLFAAMLGSGSALVYGNRGAPLTPAPPAVPRSHWLGARAGLGVLQLFALTVVPSLAIAWLSTTAAEPFDTGDALVHGLCAFVVTTLFFSLAMLLSSRLAGFWRPLLFTVLVAVTVGAVEGALQSPTAPFATMAAESYFRDGRIPWEGLAVNLALAVALYFVTARQIAKREL